MLLQIAVVDGVTVAHAQGNEQARARAAQQRAAQQAAAQQQRAAQAQAAQQRAAQEQARAAQQRAAQAQAAQQTSAASAQQTVANWVGDWAIPEAIVMCESGGNFNAVNSSSGAGGAYQILPSTWRLYGGSGAPQDASASLQSQIAAQIWRDSGPSAWACAQ